MFKHLIMGIAVLLCCGCTNPVDFSQSDDVRLEPVLESSLVFFKASASNFFTDGMLQNRVQDFVNIDLFGNSFAKDNLEKLEFVFEVKNSINRPYQLQLDFLNENGQSLESLIVDVAASPTNNIIETRHTEVFEGESLENIKQLRILVFTLIMQPGVPIDANALGEINLKSKAVMYLKI